jgi:CubicO group peptidase (beta-lactamase class C family)
VNPNADRRSRRRALPGALLFGAFAALCAAAEAGQPAVRDPALAARLDAAIQRATGGGFWGAALVARGGEVLLAKGYGFADYGSRPNAPDTLFEIASASKPFTALAVLRLEMEGKLKLEDPIAKFFPNVPADKKGITVHHLLTHTSGMDPNQGLPYASPASREEFLRFILDTPLTSKTGEKFDYFNSGYAMLAAIVEIASGKSFEEYSREKIFKPAGMADTGFVQDRVLDAKRAAARLSESMPEATCVAWHWSWGYRGMGGVVTTALDLVKWDRALRSDKILDAKTKAKAYEPRLDGYACGWMVSRTDRGTSRAEHSGSVEGFVCNIVRYLEDDALIVLLSNGKTNLFEVTKRIDAILFAKPRLTAEIDIGPYKLNEHRAVELGGNVRWKAEREGQGLRLVLEDTAKKHTVATIRMPAGPAQKLRFDLDAMIRARGPEAKPAGAEAGLYLASYEIAGTRLSLEDGLAVVLMPRYSGTDEGGNDVVDERIVFVLNDEGRRQWPVMVKMDTKTAQELLAGVAKATD